MASISKKDMQDKAIEILKNHPEGMKRIDLKKAVLDELNTSGNLKLDDVGNAIWDLYSSARTKNKVFKPMRGLFVHTDFKENYSIIDEPTKPSLDESNLYDPFAEFLGTIEDVRAVALGGHHNNVKWGTPDVIGIYKPEKQHIIQFPIEVITAEIKADTGPYTAITAFGQASAYRSFSHKVYLVLPLNEGESDTRIDRIETLCIITGIGLVVFDSIENMNFSLRVRAQKFEPNKIYCNNFLEVIKKSGLANKILP